MSMKTPGTDDDDRGATAAGSVGVGLGAARRPRTTITFYLTESLRKRARSAYRQTSYREKDGSWSDMLVKALTSEVERREELHNEGAPFHGSDEPLTPGRPIRY